MTPLQHDESFYLSSRMQDGAGRRGGREGREGDGRGREGKGSLSPRQATSQRVEDVEMGGPRGDDPFFEGPSAANEAVPL